MDRDISTHTSEPLLPRRSYTATQCHDSLEPFFDRIRRFGHDRLLGDALMVSAITKAFAVKGAIVTNLLVASYALSFFTIELLSLVALHIGPPKTGARLEAEALECVELMTLLDGSDDAWNYRNSLRWQHPGGDSLRFKIASFGIFGLFGLAFAGHLIFWPFSVPMFLFLEFTQRRKGKWAFAYLTVLEWGFWVLVGGASLLVLIAIPGLLLWKFPEKQAKYWSFFTRMLESMFKDDRFAVDAFSLLKFALIIRFYVASYTGYGTTKPGWLDWMG
jgi:hypothetical protein